MVDFTVKNNRLRRPFFPDNHSHLFFFYLTKESILHIFSMPTSFYVVANVIKSNVGKNKRGPDPWNLYLRVTQVNEAHEWREIGISIS